ncbi:hypothetical protein F0562_018347 [Nyssa sinensis]|uniref:peptidylprolyl isomerase n=1 Tax=Nyssa sinensis TaxID=561372 RepID=A0A5J4ZCB2_9ASTE|nr:hypothetical protein F0562_018347 [Nyssa sinensis]
MPLQPTSAMTRESAACLPGLGYSCSAIASLEVGIYNPWIQQRSLEYSKYESLLVGFLERVYTKAKGKLVTEEGAPNVPVIKRFFAQIDQDLDKCITFSEMEALLLDIQSKKVLDLDKDEIGKEIAEVFRAFDLNNDEMISEEEFIKGIKEGITAAMQLFENGDSNAKRSVLQPWINERRLQLTKIENLMARILKHIQSQVLEAQGLLTADGRPNLSSIESLFNRYDRNEDGKISPSELKGLIQQINFGKVKLDHDEVVEKVMKDFDEDGDNLINKQEFVSGIKKWLDEVIRVATCKDPKRFLDEFDQIKWNEVESLVYKME